MDNQTLKQFKRMFQNEKHRILMDQAKMKEELTAEQTENQDEMDLSSYEREQALILRLKNRERLYLKKIEEALTRIQRGEFGECHDCGGTIELARLKARPTATLCIDCKEEQEMKEKQFVNTTTRSMRFQIA